MVGRPGGGGTQAGPDPLGRSGFLRDEEGGLSPDGDRRAAAGLTGMVRFWTGGHKMAATYCVVTGDPLSWASFVSGGGQYIMLCAAMLAIVFAGGG